VGGSFGGFRCGATAAGAELHSQPMAVVATIEPTAVRDPFCKDVDRIVLEFQGQRTDDGGVVS